MNTFRYLRFCMMPVAATAIVSLSAPVPADARTVRNPGRQVVRQAPRTPVLAVVGLSEQRISIYDSSGSRIMEAPVSSGAPGYETPPGIFSVVQKEEEHHSNLYDDASMPFMERLTWTGIALHAGVLPGSPASHGCVRMPLDFADQLYRISNLGLRVVVLREDIAPAEVTQPFLFKSSAAAAAKAAAASGDAIKTNVSVSEQDDPGRRMEALKMVASNKALAAEIAASREKELRSVASRRAAEAAQAKRSLAAAEASVARAEADLKAAERMQQAPKSAAQAAQAEAAIVRTTALIEQGKAKLQASQLDAQAKTEALQAAEDEARAAAGAVLAANEAAEEAKQNTSPVSVFISRKTQRLYVRKANLPVFEAPVRIRDADSRIGSFVFTALDPAEGASEPRWNVVSMYKNALNPDRQALKQGAKSARSSEAGATDIAAAQAALDRLDIPQATVDRIAEVVLPGSSLIISDEGPSIETGKDTDFVVLMSGEPQGGIAIRQRPPAAEPRGYGYGYDTPWGSARGRKPYGGGGGLFDLFGN